MQMFLHIAKIVGSDYNQNLLKVYSQGPQGYLVQNYPEVPNLTQI